MLSVHGENRVGGPIVKEKNIVLPALSDLHELCFIGGGG